MVEWEENHKKQKNRESKMKGKGKSVIWKKMKRKEKKDGLVPLSLTMISQEHSLHRFKQERCKTWIVKDVDCP
jgi:hypothetical protein